MRRSGRSIRSAKIRTLLTALAIAVGTFALTLTLAASNGAQSFVDQVISENFDPSELIVAADESLIGTSSTNTPQEFDPNFGASSSSAGAVIQVKRITDEDIAKLRALDSVVDVREGVQLNILYITREGQPKLVGTISGLSPAQNPEAIAGEVVKPPADKTILIPEAYVTPLGFSSAQDAIGQKVTIALRQPVDVANLDPSIIAQIQSDPTLLTKLSENNIVTEEFTVAAILKAPTTAQPGTELYMYTNNQDARRMLDITTQGTSDFGKFLTVNAKIKNGEDQEVLEAAQDEIVALGYYTLSVEETQAFLNQAIGILQAIVATFGAIAVIASIFGIINTMYISVLQRTREIGLMKALGMRSRDVGRLFRFEAAWIGFIGGLIGAGLGLLTGYFANPIIREAIDYDGDLLKFEPLQVIGLIALLVFISVLAGWLPSRKAAKLNPIEALRTE
jgi:putative ABC transport system permease protein